MEHSVIRMAVLGGLVLLAGVVESASVSGKGTWETTLQGRDLDGNASTYEAYYDTVLDITWLADANYAQTSGFDSDGRMTWASAVAWANSLVVGTYDDWRLPTVTDIGTSGCTYGAGNLSYGTGGDCGYNVDTATGELASLWYDTLGNTPYYSTTGTSAQAGWGLSNTGPFSNLQSSVYWSGTECAPLTGGAWGFYTDGGYQDGTRKSIATMPGPCVPAMSARCRCRRRGGCLGRRCWVLRGWCGGAGLTLVLR